VTTKTYDAMDRLLSTRNPKLETTSFAYDSGDNLVSLTDAKGNTTTFEYDLLNRKTKFTYPGGSGDYEAWTYIDTASTTAPSFIYRARDGSTMSCTLDNRGRETFCDFSDPSTPDVTSTYDVAGRKLTYSTSVASHTYTHDLANQSQRPQIHVPIKSRSEKPFT
jgi:YD repeat-containing protein